MKKLHRSLLTLSILCSHLASLAMEKQSFESQKTQFLDQLHSKINKYKDSQPEQYFDDMNKVANALYLVTFPREELFTLEEKYSLCKETEKYALFNNMYVNGCRYSIYEQFNSSSPCIETHLGNLTPIQLPDGRTELCIWATSPKQRAFAKKIISLGNTHTKDECLTYLNKYRNDEDPDIKILANNYTYLFANQQVMIQEGILTALNPAFNQKPVTACLESLNLKNLFAQEKILMLLIKKAHESAEETPPSIIEKLQPICSSSIFNTLHQEDSHLLYRYKTIITELQNNLCEYALKQSKKNTTPAQFKKSIKPLRKKYLYIAPELAGIYSFYGLKGELPGVNPIEIPQTLITITTKKSPSSQPKKQKRSRGAKQRKKNKTEEKNTATHQDITIKTAEQQIPQTLLTKPIKTEAAILDTQENVAIYDNRVLEQNKNKDDSYHGFTLMTVPFILKHGSHKTWTNKKTQHADDLFEMYGEIEYHKTNEPKLVKFVICKGADNAIYHIQMSPADHNETQSINKNQYNIEFPPLGTVINTSKNSSYDEYDSAVIAETDYMARIKDNGLDATITLYK